MLRVHTFFLMLAISFLALGYQRSLDCASQTLSTRQQQEEDDLNLALVLSMSMEGQQNKNMQDQKKSGEQKDKEGKGEASAQTSGSAIVHSQEAKLAGNSLQNFLDPHLGSRELCTLVGGYLGAPLPVDANFKLAYESDQVRISPIHMLLLNNGTILVVGEKSIGLCWARFNPSQTIPPTPEYTKFGFRETSLGRSNETGEEVLYAEGIESLVQIGPQSIAMKVSLIDGGFRIVTYDLQEKRVLLSFKPEIQDESVGLGYFEHKLYIPSKLDINVYDCATGKHLPELTRSVRETDGSVPEGIQGRWRKKAVPPFTLQLKMLPYSHRCILAIKKGEFLLWDFGPKMQKIADADKESDMSINGVFENPDTSLVISVGKIYIGLLDKSAARVTHWSKDFKDLEVVLALGGGSFVVKKPQTFFIKNSEIVPGRGQSDKDIKGESFSIVTVDWDQKTENKHQWLAFCGSIDSEGNGNPSSFMVQLPDSSLVLLSYKVLPLQSERLPCFRIWYNDLVRYGRGLVSSSSSSSSSSSTDAPCAHSLPYLEGNKRQKTKHQ